MITAKKTMAGDRYILLLVYSCFGLSVLTTGTPTLDINRRAPVDGLPLELTCKLSSSSPSQVQFTAGSTTVANCSSWNTGSCSLSNSTAYSIRYNTGRSEITLNIRSFTAYRDALTWYCTHSSQSNRRDLQTSSSVLDWQNVTTNPSSSDFPDRLNETSSVAIALNTPCAKGRVTVRPTYTDDKGGSGSLTALSDTPTPCSAGSERRTIVYSLSGNNQAMRDKLIQINISLEHDSFPPDNGYTRSILLGPIQFPVRVQTVTLRNISRNGEVIKILRDKDLVLACESSPGFPTVVVQWFKHNPTKQALTSGVLTRTVDVTPVVKRTISTFTIRMSTSDNGQIYSCEGSNSDSQTPKSSFRANVDVLYPPSSPSLLPSSPSVLEEREVTLTCTSSERGNPSCTYIWKKNNAIQSAAGSTYTFTATKADNGVSLQCQAINEYTNSTSATLSSPIRTLTVYYKPRVTLSRSSLSLKEGDTLNVDCTADSNPPSSSFKWTSPTSRILSNSAVLIESNLSRDDHGSYTCEAVVSAPSYGQLSGSATIQVTVNYAPDITMAAITVREGEQLELVCQASGRPSTYSFQSFEQFWETTHIRSIRGSKSGSKYTLRKSSVTHQDWGEYECSVDNGIRNRSDVLRQTKRVLVNVQAPPVYISGLRSLAVESGEDINITLRWFSRPEMTSHEWKFEDGSRVTFPSSSIPTNLSVRIHGRNVLQSGHQIQLTLTKVQQNNFGTYTNIVCNSIRCRNITVFLRASGPPLVPLDFTVVNTSTESAWLRWKPNFPGGNFIQRFVLYYRVKDSGANWTKEVVPQGTGNFTFKRVLGLQIGTTYTFKLQSINNHPTLNQGPLTSEIYLETKGLNQDGGIGAGVGIGVGATSGLILLVVAAGLIYKFRRQIQGISMPCRKTKTPDTCDDVPEGGDACDGNTNYSGLQMRPGPSIHSYEGLALQPKASSSDATVGKNEDPYVNTKFHKQKKGGKPAILPKPAKIKSKNRTLEGHVYQNYC